MRQIEANWLEGIPAHWDVRRLKDVVTLSTEKTDKHNLPYIGLENISNWDSRYIPSDIESDGTNSVFHNGDILYSKLRPYLAKGFLATYDGICSTEFLVLRPSSDIYSRYLLLYLLSPSVIDFVNSQVAGVKMPRTSWDEVGALDIPLPTIDEQIRISAYLDAKIANINEYMNIRRSELNFLRTLRRSRVNEVVVKGLRDDRPLKDSGEKWIGVIPDEWRIMRIGSCFEERREQVSDTEYAPLSVTKQGIFPQLEGVAKTENGENRKKVCVGDFVINSRSDRKGSSGVSKYDGSVSLINIVLTSNGSILPDFCNYLFKSSRFIDEYYRMGHGIVADLWTTGYNDMRTINIAVPPIEEQKEITAYLDEECEKIDRKCELIDEQIKKLQLLKRALINEVVTGKRQLA